MINKNQKVYKYFKIFSAVMVLIATSLATILVCSIISTIIDNELYSRDFCLSSECIDKTSFLFKGSIDLAKNILFLITSIATTAGIFFAIFSYLNVAQTNALNSHISHFKIFQDFVLSEISKRYSIESRKVDIFKWYNLMFRDSKMGSIAVSYDYVLTIKTINSKIESSNRKAENAMGGSFKYKDHQKSMIDALDSIGINLNYHPRNDFYEIEGQLLELIEIINKAFAAEISSIGINPRNYI
jgi:hypothetical protein